MSERAEVYVATGEVEPYLNIPIKDIGYITVTGAHDRQQRVENGERKTVSLRMVTKCSRFIDMPFNCSILMYDHGVKCMMFTPAMQWRGRSQNLIIRGFANLPVLFSECMEDKKYDLTEREFLHVPTIKIYLHHFMQ